MDRKLVEILKGILTFSYTKGKIDSTFATTDDVIIAAQGIQGSVATHAALVAVAPGTRAIGMWKVNNDENYSNRSSWYANDGTAYTWRGYAVYGADDVETVTSSFDSILNGTDTDAQKAFDTIDNYFGNKNVETKEPTGFVNRTDSNISFDNGLTQFSIAPAVSIFEYWVKGVRYSKSSTESIVLNPATEGLHYIYYNGSTLSETTTWNDNLFTDSAIISIIYWDATNDQAIIFAEERHGCTMTGKTHQLIHNIMGAQRESGLALGNFDINGNGDQDTAAQHSVANGKIYDEDIKIDIEDGSPQDLSTIAQVPVYYHETGAASGNWRKKKIDYSQWQADTVYSSEERVFAVTGNASTRGLIFECTSGGTSGGSEPAWQDATGTVDADGGDPVGATTTDNTVTWTCYGSILAPVINAKSGSYRIAYNEFSGGTWGQTEVGNNDYLLIHIFATTDSKNPIIAIQGQEVYTTIGAARTGATVEATSIITVGIPTIEFVLIASEIYQTGTGLENHCKGRIISTDTGDNYIDWRDAKISQAAAPASHANLADLNYDTAGHTGFGRATESTASDPTANNDSVDTAALGKEFKVGDSWHNTSSNHFFIATDVTATAAVWRETLTQKLEVIVDGNSTAITTGLKGFLEVPFDCVIVGNRLLTDVSTSTVVDIWKTDYSDFDAGSTHPVDGDSITASAPGTIIAGIKSEDTTLTGWTPALTKGDLLGFNIDSNDNATKLNVILDVIRI